MILSISLIVKNEEKYLDGCLSSIKKLMDLVESELIIVDTGSTDKTKEIALKYTDKVYDFKWTGDFSEARNFGLSKCSGQWFMYLDADEYLDSDITELANFFNDNSYENIGHNSKIRQVACARLRLKNYSDSTLSVYSESHNLRIYNLGLAKDSHDKVKFVGAVHESLPEKEPCVLIDTFVHHYGYIADSDPAVLSEKRRRNMPALLKEYKNNPIDPRVLAHLFYSCEPEDKEKYLTEWYNALINSQNQVNTSIYALPVYASLIQTLLDGNEVGSALFYIDEYIERYSERLSITTLSVIALGVCALSNVADYSNALEFYNVYLDLWSQFQSGQISDAELDTCVVFFGSTTPDFIGLTLLAADAALRLGNTPLATDILQKLDGMEIPKLLKEQYSSIKKQIK